jgi:c-di-AMP phosphodiesterase-like protein
MEQLIDFVTENPLYAVGVVLFTLLLLIALVKKAIKIAILAVALNAGYIYYLQDSAEKYYAKGQDKVEQISQEASKVGEQAENLLDEAGNLIK